MCANGYSRNITRVAVNPRLTFGVSLDKLCSNGRLHPGLRDLFLKAYLCTGGEDSFRRKKSQLIGHPDAGHTVLKLFEPGERGQGALADRLILKTRLEAGEWIVATPTPPGAPLWLLEHFLGSLPCAIFSAEHWKYLSEQCKECVENAINGTANASSLIQKLAKFLKRLSVAEFLTLAALQGLIRNLSAEGHTTNLNKTAIMILVRYFIPSLVSRPYKPGLISAKDRQIYPLLLFLCYYWSEIREACKSFAEESPRTSGPSSLTNIHQEAMKTNQKKFFSLPNKGLDKKIPEKTYILKNNKIVLPTSIPEKYICLCKGNPNYGFRQHGSGYIWNLTFPGKEIGDAILFKNRNNSLRSPTVFICACCGKRYEKMDQETQCDVSRCTYEPLDEDTVSFLYMHKKKSSLTCSDSEMRNLSLSSVENHENKSKITQELVNTPGSTSLLDRYGIVGQPFTSTLSSLEERNINEKLHEIQSNSSEIYTFYSCSEFYESFSNACNIINRSKDNSYEITDKNEFSLQPTKQISQSVSMPHLPMDLFTSLTNVPVASSPPCVNTRLEEEDKTVMYSPTNDGAIGKCKGNTCNKRTQINCDTLTTEDSVIRSTQGRFNNVRKCRKNSSPGWTNPSTAAELSSRASPNSSAAKCQAKYHKTTINSFEQEYRHDGCSMLENNHLKPTIEQKHCMVKSKTYPFQSPKAVAGIDEDDTRPRRYSERSAEQRSKTLRNKTTQWLRETINHGRLQISRRLGRKRNTSS